MGEIIFQGTNSEFITMAIFQGIFIFTGVFVNLLSWVSLRIITDASAIFKQILLVLVCLQLVNLCFSQTYILNILVFQQSNLGEYSCKFYSYVSLWTTMMTSWLLLLLVTDRFIYYKFERYLYYYTSYCKFISCVMWLALFSLSFTACYNLLNNVSHFNSADNLWHCDAPYSKNSILINSAVTYIVPMTIKMTLLIYLTCSRRKNKIEQEIIKPDAESHTTRYYGDDLNDITDLEVKVERPKTPWGEAWWSDINHKIKSGPNTTLPPLSTALPSISTTLPPITFNFPQNKNMLLLTTRTKSITADNFPHGKIKMIQDKYLGGSMPDLNNINENFSENASRIAWEERRQSQIRDELFKMADTRISSYKDDDVDTIKITSQRSENSSRENSTHVESDEPINEQKYLNSDLGKYDRGHQNISNNEKKLRKIENNQINTVPLFPLDNINISTVGMTTKTSHNQRTEDFLRNNQKNIKNSTDDNTENSRNKIEDYPSAKTRWLTQKSKKEKMDDKDLGEADDNSSASEKQNKETSWWNSIENNKFREKQDQKKSINSLKTEDLNTDLLRENFRESLSTSQQSQSYLSQTNKHKKSHTMDIKTRAITLQNHGINTVDKDENQSRIKELQTSVKLKFPPNQEFEKRSQELSSLQEKLANKKSLNSENNLSHKSNNSVNIPSHEVIGFEKPSTTKKIVCIHDRRKSSYVEANSVKCTSKKVNLKLTRYIRTLVIITLINLVLTLPRICYEYYISLCNECLVRYWLVWTVNIFDNISCIFTPLLLVILHKSFRVIAVYFLNYLVCKC